MSVGLNRVRPRPKTDSFLHRMTLSCGVLIISSSSWWWELVVGCLELYSIAWTLTSQSTGWNISTGDTPSGGKFQILAPNSSPFFIKVAQRMGGALERGVRVHFQSKPNWFYHILNWHSRIPEAVLIIMVTTSCIFLAATLMGTCVHEKNINHEEVLCPGITVASITGLCDRTTFELISLANDIMFWSRVMSVFGMRPETTSVPVKGSSPNPLPSTTMTWLPCSSTHKRLP